MSRTPGRINFSYLTSALLLFLLLNSVVHEFLPSDSDFSRRVIEGALVVTLATGVWSVRREYFIFNTTLGLAAGITLVALGGLVLDLSGLWLLHSFLLVVFLLLMASATAKRVLFSGFFDRNAIVGAICVYLLLGLIWAMIYMILEIVLPGSFKGITHNDPSAVSMEFVYYSYISISTMGYGDITPQLPLARFFSFLEGIIGQFYLAVLVASLVGVNVSSWRDRKDNHDAN